MNEQVHKVRFVASTLLDAVRKAETAPASAARAHAYLCKLPPFSHCPRPVPACFSLPPCAPPLPPFHFSSSGGTWRKRSALRGPAGRPDLPSARPFPSRAPFHLTLPSPFSRLPFCLYIPRTSGLADGASRHRGLPVHPVGDRAELPVSLPALLPALRAARARRMRGTRTRSLTVPPPHRRLDDDRDALTNDVGIPLMGN